MTAHSKGPWGHCSVPQAPGPQVSVQSLPGEEELGDATHPALDRGCAQEDADSHGQQA